jgi:hypothetical protein
MNTATLNQPTDTNPTGEIWVRDNKGPHPRYWGTGTPAEVMQHNQRAKGGDDNAVFSWKKATSARD